MELLRTIRDQDIDPDSDTTPRRKPKLRRAARGVVLDDNNQIILVHSGVHGYYKLPGGGINSWESIEGALYRELREETGYSSRVLSPVGRIVEHRSRYNFRQTSYCYLVRRVGEPLPLLLDPYEEKASMAPVNAPNIDEAIKLLEGHQLDDYSFRFMVMRDLTFLVAAKALIESGTER